MGEPVLEWGSRKAIRGQLVLLVILAIMVILGLTLMPAKVRAAECLENPMDGIEENRWEILDPCYTTEGLVNLYSSSSGGAYWVQIQRDDGTTISGKIFSQFTLQKPDGFERIRLTGALVFDNADANKGRRVMTSYGMVEIVPVWKLERLDLLGQYNQFFPTWTEIGPPGWYRVSYLKGDRWHTELIMPSLYKEAGIRG